MLTCNKKFDDKVALKELKTRINLLAETNSHLITGTLLGISNNENLSKHLV